LAEIAAGRFREDLYYRLHVVPIELPPLRARGNDILLIAQRLLASFSHEEGKGFVGFVPEAQTLFRAFSWPGNVRQLQNVVRNIVVLHDGTAVTLDMVPQELRTGSVESAAAPALPQKSQSDLRAAIKPLAVVERDAIEAAVNSCGGNLTEAARQLGINVSTVYRKLRSWQDAA
jgi:two-component system repressor protein LuxO